MEIICPNCGQTCEVDEEPEPGRHLLCPFCDVKFSYTPQNTTGDNADRISNAVEPQGEGTTEKIKMSSPHCGTMHEVNTGYIGVTATCGTCSREFIITETQTADEQDVCSSDRHVEAMKEELLENASDEANESAATTLRKERFKAFSEKTKMAAISAKNITFSLWRSGWKGKAVITGFVILLALCLFVLCISSSNADANYKMGLQYLKGDGVEKDVVKATELFRQAAGQGNADAQYQLGAIYGSLQDWNESAKWYQAAAEQGHAKAKLGLGFCYIFGLGVAKNEDKGTQLINEAKQDPQLQDQIQDLLSHFRFADNKQLYSNGKDAEDDKTKGVGSLRLAAEIGNAEAQAALGLCYYNGESVTRNDKEAMKWFQRAAEQGHAGSQCLLGLGYESGTGVPKNMNEAVKWLVKAGNQGQAKAQLELASLYFLGRGVERDYGQSMKWCRMAAEQGEPEAQYMYAGFYRNGLGMPVDMKEAARWYRKAAEQGYSRAQKALDEVKDATQQSEVKKTKSRSIVCCNLANNALAPRTKSIAFLESKPYYRCKKVRFTNDPKKADAVFCFGCYFHDGNSDLEIKSYTYDSSRADVVYNVVDANPYCSNAKETVYIVKDMTSSVDMTLCITHDKSVLDAIKIEEPNITSDSDQQRTAIMYMLGFFK